MAAQRPLLESDPTGTIFFSPYNEVFRGKLVVRNVVDVPVVFKVKTNRAERYAVKPHMAILQPGEVATVTCACARLPRTAAAAARLRAC
jgi:hypothetical protein